MALSNSFLERIADRLGHGIIVIGADPVGGGSINDAYRLRTNKGSYFLKVNQADRFPSMFEAEADGLARLRKTNTIRIPEVHSHGETDGMTYLLLEDFSSGVRTEHSWRSLGRGLAALHLNSSPSFGLERNNYIGSLEQVNTPEGSWAAFFIQERLEPMVKMARDNHKVEAGMAFRFERLYGKVAELLPNEPPALLHGDLWHGNLLFDPEGRPVLFDPAVYYGHREMDIAMTQLFGGFDEAFLSAYNDEMPLEEGWKERVDLCNLYPLLVHVNLFGGAYVQQVEGVLRRFT